MALSQLKRNIDLEMSRIGNDNITGTQLMVVYAIQTHGICNMTQLADIMGVKPSAITVMMDRLVEAGFIERTHDTTDRRAVLVKVTDAGKAVLEEAIAQRGQILKNYLSRLEPDELNTLAKLLEKVVST